MGHKVLKNISNRPQYRLAPVVLVLSFLLCSSGLFAQPAQQEELHLLRQARRHASKEFQLNKTHQSTPAQFGLLVIPVDFEDVRFPSGWDPQSTISPQIFGSSGQTMENYFHVASDGKIAMNITIAPVAHLSGVRDDYSDIGWNGSTRTRALATEAITDAALQGLEFRRLDMDGPDGLPGSGDDDGQVDGVLILHSGVGQENDTVRGKIQALQFYIDPPVISGGIEASFYAVASAQSGLGIWAHETAHLLGMEDRYDPRLQPEAGLGDIRSLGGLGQFSLMSSGAWGTGDGQNPALPDAYSCWQLGWTSPQRYPLADNPPCTVSSWRNEGVSPVLAWTSGLVSSEFLLMETRNPEDTFPFDATLSPGQMLIYHVDETVPEGWYILDDGYGYHLRVQLVEADNDNALRGGDDDGRDEDLFPGPLNVQTLTPYTAPNSQGYSGNSQVSIEAISTHGNYVTCTISDSPSNHTIDMSFSVITEINSYLDFQVFSLGDDITELACTIDIAGLGGGEFPGGLTSIQVPLQKTDGIWTPLDPVIFVPPINPDPGATTQFNFLLMADGHELPVEHQLWVWVSDVSIFDFNNPEWIFWEEDFPNNETNTRWFLWDQSPFLTADGSAVLACTGEGFPSSASWPDVQYGRRGRAAIISPEIGDDFSAIQLTHAIEVEFLHAGTIMDGATAFWQGPDGALVEATPVDGWDAIISAQSNNSLGGAGAFADSMLHLDAENLPQWRCDVLELPSTGQGPWRLRLEFSSNYTWRWRGWFIGEILPLFHIPSSAFPINWQTENGDCPGLSWNAPEPQNSFINPVVEYFDANSGRYMPFPDQENQIGVCSDAYSIQADFILAHLRPSGLNRHLVRLVFEGPKGMVASRSVVVYPDEGAQPVEYLEQPFPNPSTGNVKFLLDLPNGEKASLKIFDLRGRLVYKRDCESGRYQIVWDGVDAQGRRLASGTYYLKLEGSGFSSLRKVVLVR